MNLSPEWARVLGEEGWEARHWSSIGNPRAEDPEIMAWARDNDCVVLTHDLDFGTLLALTQAGKPSVVQLRAEDVTPHAMRVPLVSALRQFSSELADGALIVIE